MSLPFYIEKLANAMITIAKAYDEMDEGHKLTITKTADGYSWGYKTVEDNE